MPLVTLFDHLETPVTPVRQRLRREPTNAYLHVREVKGGAWQVRPWLGLRSGGSLNLGLFTRADHPADIGDSPGAMAEWAAGRASKAFRTFYRPHVPGRGLREALEHLKAKKYIPQDVLPPRVRRVPGGYRATVRKGDRVLETEVFTDEWATYEAMCALLAREFPADPRRAESPKDGRADRDQALITLADFTAAA